MSFNITDPWSKEPVTIVVLVIVIIVNIRDVDDIGYLDRLVVNIRIPVIRVEMTTWNKCPPEAGGIPVKVDIDLNVWSHRSPSPVIII